MSRSPEEIWDARLRFESSEKTKGYNPYFEIVIQEAELLGEEMVGVYHMCFTDDGPTVVK